MGAYGLRPVAEIQFADYILPAFDQLVSEAARLRYRSNGEFWAPITVRAPYGGGIFGGQTHSQSPEALFAHVTGLCTVIPSNPYDAKGLLIAAIESNDPVIFLEPKRIYNGPFDGHHDRQVKPWAEHPAGRGAGRPLHRAAGQGGRPCAKGSDVTVLAYGTMVHVAACGDRGIRHRCRIDRPALHRAAGYRAPSPPRCKKTGRCVIVHEASRFAGFGAELSALVQERCFYHLKAPIARVTGWDTPYPHAFEWDYFPGPGRVAARR